MNAWNFDDLTGKRYNCLNVIKQHGKSKNGKKLLWECQCDCGSTIYTPGDALKAGRPKACAICSQKARAKSSIICKICNIEKPRDSFYASNGQAKNICKECHKPLLNEKKKNRTKNQRLEALKAYSDPPACACCNETNIEFLTFDHIHGGGNKHRKDIIKGSGDFVRWLKANNYPEGIRILCYNCNTSLGLHGYCPHNQLPSI